MDFNFIQADGHYFTYRGERIRLRGFGIGNWLNIEHFMIGMPTPDSMIQSAFESVFGKKAAADFFIRYRNHYAADEDFCFLKQCGVNFIRVPFNYRLFIDDADEDHYKEEGFSCIDRLMKLCKKYQIFVLLDLHAVPGGQNPDWHSDNVYGVPLFWRYRALQMQTTRLWAAIASRYRDEEYLMGYDLVNEPAMAGWDKINQFYQDTIRAIRKADKNHLIILEGDQFSMDFSGLALPDDWQTAISFHYYPTVWYPYLLNSDMDREQRKREIAEGLEKFAALRTRFNRPVFCGEFGYGIDCGGHDFVMGLLEDTIDLLEEYEMEWLLWSYKDAHFMSLTAPKRDSVWMSLVKQIGKDWSQEIEKKQAAAVLELLEDNWYPQMSDEEKYLLQFRLRACFYSLQKAHILIPALERIGIEGLEKLSEDILFKNSMKDLDMLKIIENTLVGKKLR